MRGQYQRFRGTIDQVSRWWALVAMAACAIPRNANPPLTLPNGPLVDMDEGTTVEVATSEAVSVVSGPPWASTGGGATLMLMPDCSTVPGTDGPPALFSVELAPAAFAGESVHLDVQVHPSAAGMCMPFLFGNVANNSGCPATWPGMPQEVYSRNTTVPIDFSGPLDFDRVLYLDVSDPESMFGVGDPQLTSHVSSNAPLEFKVYSNPNFRCAPIPNAGITGEFELDYSIAKDTSSPAIAQGSWTIAWLPFQAFGIQVVSCAPSSGTCVREEPNKVGAPSWCIGTAAGATVTLLVNVWANKQMGWVPPFDATLAARLSSASVVGLIGPDREVIGSSTPSLPIQFDPANLAAPVAVTVDLSQAQPGDQLTLQVTSPLIDPNVVTTQVDMVAAPSTCP